MSTPRAGAVIGGTSYTLSSSLTSLPAAYSVEYDVSSEVACIAVRAPFSCSWNTYYFFGGPAGVVAIARDAANNVLATSTQVGFTVHNPLPSNNPNNTFSVTPSIAWTSAWRGTVSFKIAEGSNISGDFMYLNGAAIGKTANESPQYYLDTSRWRNGRYRIVFVFTAADGLNGQWNQIGQVERSVTFSNGSAAMELHNSAHEIPLCTTARPDCPANYTLTSRVYHTDGTSAAATNLAFFSDNTAVATVNGSGSRGRVTQAGEGTAQIWAVSETERGTDLQWGAGGFVSSPSHPFTAHDIGDLIYVSGGAKGWVPGWYSITKVAPSTGFAFVTPSPCPRCADGTKGGIWTSGPSEPSIVQVSTKNAIGNFGADGSLNQNYVAGKSILFSSWFGSAGALGDSSYPAGRTLAGDYALAGFNTFEVNPSNSNNGLSNTSTEAAWKNAQASYIADEVRLISGYYADGAGHVPFGWFLIGDPMIRGNSGLYWYTQYPPFQSWSPPPVQYLSAQWVGKNVRGMSGVDEVNYLYGWNPLSGPITIGTNGFTRISCVASASCTVSWAHPSMVSNFSSNFFVITGSGTRLDYDTTATNPCPKPYSLRNTSGPTFTFPAPAGMSSMTLTAQTNPGTTIQQYAASVFDAAGNEGPDYGNASLAGPCVDWVHANAFKTYSSQWMRPSGHAPLTFSVAGSADAATVQNWQGNPKISDFTDFYFIGSSPYIARYSSTNALLTTIGAAFRYRFNNFGPNRTKPILMEGSGVNVNYGYEGAPASIATASDATLTFTNGGCPANVQPWSTRLMIRGASTSAYNGNFYVANGPTAGECNIAYATAQFEANLTGLTATATFDPSGATYSISALTAAKNAYGTTFTVASGTDPNCTVIHHQGETVTFSGIGIGRFSGATFYYPTVINPRNCGTPMYMAQMPSGVSCASHCGTAYILPDAGYLRGRNYSAFEIGPRQEAAVNEYCFIMGCAGNRIYAMQPNNQNDPHVRVGGTMAFDTTENTSSQAASHPLYPFGLAQLGWHSNTIPTKLGARLIKFMFQPRIPCPDYGFSPPFALFETSCRSGPYGKIEMIELFADGPQTVTPDFSPIAVAGQPTLRYCESWQGITITTIAAGITSETLTMDPDRCQFAAYAGAVNEAQEYTPPTLSFRLAGVPNARDVSLQYSYSPYVYSSSQVNTLALPDAVDFGGASGILPIDLQIGDVYYRTLYRNSAGAVIAVSGVQCMAGVNSTCPASY